MTTTRRADTGKLSRAIFASVTRRNADAAPAGYRAMRGYDTKVMISPATSGKRLTS